MSKERIILAMVVLFLIDGISVKGQENKTYILERTNIERLSEMASDFMIKSKLQRQIAIEKANQEGWDTVNLIRLDDLGDPVYYTTFNDVAAGITKTTNLRDTYGVQGQSMLIGEWDGGSVRETHNDLAGRVDNQDNVAISSHATHVAGTLIGNPTNGNNSSKGMAPLATLNSYDWNSDLAEMAVEANNGMLISNHSYGAVSGWEKDEPNDCILESRNRWTWYGPSTEYNSGGDDYKFGQYDIYAESLDELCWSAPFYLPVFAAGNDHSNSPVEGITCDDDVRNGQNGTYEDYDEDIHPRGDGDQISCISTYQNAKNILTIGNLKDDLGINNSSSRGKTDDGRIKPDLCGNGTGLWSADSNSDSHYSFKTGTSMASPNVAGSLLLLQELYASQNDDTYMRSATIKALAIHTATDLGLIGPDFTYGWGLFNAKEAGDVIVESASNLSVSNMSKIVERVFTTSMSSDSYYFNGGSDPIKVTLAYTDIEGTGSGNHNETTPELVHDLDIRLYDLSTGNLESIPFSGGTTFLPTFGDNDIDNVEQIIDISPTTNGTYEIRVTVEGGLQANQNYSLVISGIDNSCVSEITHDGTILSKVYRASNDITSTGVANNGQIIVYQAGNKVKLNPGFKANLGTYFKADTKGCQE